MRDFRKLSVWEKAHSLTIEIYHVTSGFPQNEIYGLRTQIRRACSSIPANTAEGCGRNGDADFRRFIQISMGSASELEYHLLLAHHLRLIDNQKYENINLKIVEIKRMLASLIQKLRADS
jgi:four helix bundle protein